jgi:hypothetical protein
MFESLDEAMYGDPEDDEEVKIFLMQEKLNEGNSADVLKFADEIIKKSSPGSKEYKDAQAQKGTALLENAGIDFATIAKEFDSANSDDASPEEKDFTLIMGDLVGTPEKRENVTKAAEALNLADTTNKTVQLNRATANAAAAQAELKYEVVSETTQQKFASLDTLRANLINNSVKRTNWLNLWPNINNESSVNSWLNDITLTNIIIADQVKNLKTTTYQTSYPQTTTGYEKFVSDLTKQLIKAEDVDLDAWYLQKEGVLKKVDNAIAGLLFSFLVNPTKLDPETVYVQFNPTLLITGNTDPLKDDKIIKLGLPTQPDASYTREIFENPKTYQIVSEPIIDINNTSHDDYTTEFFVYESPVYSQINQTIIINYDNLELFDELIQKRRDVIKAKTQEEVAKLNNSID